MEYILFGFILLVLTILLVTGIKKHNKNMLNAVIVISIVTFLIYPVGFRSAYIMFDDGTDALNGVLKLLINIVIRQCLLAVLFASALIFKTKIGRTNEKFRKQKNSFVVITLSIIISIAFIFVSWYCIIFVKNYKITRYVIENLKSKYGDKGYEITNVENDYSYMGFTDKYLYGYDIDVKDNTGYKFNVNVTKDLTSFNDNYVDLNSKNE